MSLVDAATGEVVEFAWVNHPAADRYPMMSDEQLSELADDIAANGQLEPVWLDEDGQLLDGRNRLSACRSLGIEPRCEVYRGDDIEAFVASMNEHRRHLTPEQRIKLRRERVAAARAEGKSTTQIAEDEGIDDKTVRTDLQVRTDSEPVDEPPAKVEGKDGKTYPSKRRTYTDDEQLAAIERYDNSTGAEREQMATDMGVKLSSLYQRIAEWKRRHGVGKDPQRGAATETRLKVETIRDLASQGVTSQSMAKRLGISSNWVRTLTRENGIEIVADKVLRNTRIIDHDRVVEQTIVHATCDQATLDLIDYGRLDRDRLPEWISSLQAAIKDLTTIKRNLERELS